MTVLQSRMLPPAAILAGMILAVLMLFVPVRADFSDDTMLNLRTFDRQRSLLPTEVDCGPAPENVLDPQGGGTIYDLTRDDACHRAGYRRFWLAIATGAVFVGAGLVGFVATEWQE